MEENYSFCVFFNAFSEFYYFSIFQEQSYYYSMIHPSILLFFLWTYRFFFVKRFNMLPLYSLESYNFLVAICLKPYHLIAIDFTDVILYSSLSI